MMVLLQIHGNIIFRHGYYAFSQHNVFLSRKEFVLYEATRPIELAQAVCRKYKVVLEKAPDVVAAKEKYFIDYCKPRIYHGVFELLVKLKQKGIKLGLVSSGNRIRINKTTPQNIVSQFDAVVTGEEVDKPKPDPEPYQKCLSKLQVSPSNAIVMEDSPLGVESAKAAGCYCIAVLSTRNRKQLYKADIIVDSIEEVEMYAT